MYWRFFDTNLLKLHRTMTTLMPFKHKFAQIIQNNDHIDAISNTNLLKLYRTMTTLMLFLTQICSKLISNQKRSLQYSMREMLLYVLLLILDLIDAFYDAKVGCRKQIFQRTNTQFEKVQSSWSSYCNKLEYLKMPATSTLV